MRTVRAEFLHWTLRTFRAEVLYWSVRTFRAEVLRRPLWEQSGLRFFTGLWEHSRLGFLTDLWQPPGLRFFIGLCENSKGWSSLLDCENIGCWDSSWVSVRTVRVEFLHGLVWQQSGLGLWSPVQTFHTSLLSSALAFLLPVFFISLSSPPLFLSLFSFCIYYFCIYFCIFLFFALLFFLPIKTAVLKGFVFFLHFLPLLLGKNWSD